MKNKATMSPTETEPALLITLTTDNKEALRIERDGKIIWTHNGEKEVCEDFKDLAKAFMFTILKVSPQLDWGGTAPEIYEEIKHLLK